MRLPNLVIIGAPKAGTSSFFRWLSDHPQASGSSVKETFYLMDPGHPLLNPKTNYHSGGLSGYETFFTAAGIQHEIVFEATTHYLYQDTALQVLREITPRPQIVVLLRRPTERVYSSYQYTRNNLAAFKEDLSFSRLLKMIESEPMGEFAERFCNVASGYVLKHDIQYSQYIDYLSKWIVSFGRENVHIFLFEELSRSPGSLMRSFARRVGIDPSFYNHYDFERRNETLPIRNHVQHRMARKVARLIPAGWQKTFLKWCYLRIQSAPKTAFTNADAREFARLKRHFQPYNERLSQEVGVPLEAWQ